MNLLNYLSNEGILMSDMERLYKYSKYQDYKNSTVAKIFGNEEIVNKDMEKIIKNVAKTVVIE